MQATYPERGAAARHAWLSSGEHLLNATVATLVVYPGALFALFGDVVEALSWVPTAILMVEWWLVLVALLVSWLAGRAARRLVSLRARIAVHTSVGLAIGIALTLLLLVGAESTELGPDGRFAWLPLLGPACAAAALAGVLAVLARRAARRRRAIRREAAR